MPVYHLTFCEKVGGTNERCQVMLADTLTDAVSLLIQTSCMDVKWDHFFFTVQHLTLNISLACNGNSQGSN